MGPAIVIVVAACELCVLGLYIHSRGRKRAKFSTPAGTATGPNRPWESLESPKPPPAKTNGVTSAAVAGPNPISVLLGRVGQSSKVAGIGFTALAIGLLFLSAATQAVVYEVDSVVAFMAAVVLLFRDPRARVLAGVFDAVLLSANRIVGELSVNQPGFTYVPTGQGFEDVVVVPNDSLNYPDGPSNRSAGARLTPPGRALALLYLRESGLTELTVGGISADLPRIVHEDFGLADSVQVTMTQERVEVVLRGATAECGCETKSKDADGTIGCVVGSFFAVLYSSATRRRISLEKCNRDPTSGVWKVAMNLLPSSQAGAR